MSLRNQTIILTEKEKEKYAENLISVEKKVDVKDVLNRTILGNTIDVLSCLPDHCVDLIVTDPPYNLRKIYGETVFRKQTEEEYMQFLNSWIPALKRVLKPTGSVYICIDWTASGCVERVARQYFTVRNRITWEREKGRGALKNWKNCSEDIWFLTASDSYTFNVDAVKLKRRVLAPYRDNEGNRKDWDSDGFRLTSPSNLWTDISVPFWSMPENTEHPTQKPEKLVAKLVLASSNPEDVVLDCFLGSGTTSVVCRKLGRNYIGIEREEKYALLAEKRLDMAKVSSKIQGYEDGFFWERNALANKSSRKEKK